MHVDSGAELKRRESKAETVFALVCILRLLGLAKEQARAATQ
jgi:hypothetical protein